MTRVAGSRLPRFGPGDLGAVVLLAVVALAQGWSGAVLTHVLPFLQADYDLTDARVFDLMTVVRAASLGALAFSWWGDNRGRRLPLLAAFALLPLANLASAFATGPGALAVLQSVARLATIAVSGLALVVLAEQVRPAVRAHATAIYVLFGAIGTGLGLLLRPLGAEGDGWRLLFALSALPLVALPMLLKRLREPELFVRPKTRPPLTAVLRSLHARRFWPMAALSFAVSAYTTPAANLALVRLEGALAWSPGSASLLVAAASAPGVLAGLAIGGRMADSLGRRPTEALAIATGVGGGLAFYLIDGGWPLVVGILFSNLGAFAFAPAFAAHRAELFPTEVRATASAWIVNASIVGGIAGFAAGRFVVDAWGIDRTVSALGLMLLGATALLLALPETKGISLGRSAADPPEPTSSTPG